MAQRSKPVRIYEPYFYEDLQVGTEFLTPKRTVTETDLIQFAMLTSDWNTVHTDATAAAKSEFGRRIVHGALGMSLATGLVQRTGMFEGSAVALLDFEQWTFKHPLFVGDTIHTRLQIESKRLTSKGDRGIVRRHLSLINQENVTIQEGISNFMVWTKTSKRHLRHQEEMTTGSEGQKE
jgi:acyl dehydratase